LSANSADYSDTDSEAEDDRTQADKDHRAALKRARQRHRRELERKREEKRRLMTYGIEGGSAGEGDGNVNKSKYEGDGVSQKEQRRREEEEAEREALKFDGELLSLSQKSIKSASTHAPLSCCYDNCLITTPMTTIMILTEPSLLPLSNHTLLIIPITIPYPVSHDNHP
jgi:hypothetical protein